MTREDLKIPQSILISCGDESSSSGDEAILASTLKLIKKKYPDSKVTVFANNPELIKSIYSVNTIPKGESFLSFGKSFFTILRSIRNCDLLIWGGGQLIQDTSSQFYIPNHIWRFFIANLFKKKVIVFAIGASHLKTNFSKFLVKSQLKKAKKISVRDKESAEVLLDLGLSEERINILYDPALILRDYDRKLGLKLLKKIGVDLSKPVIGFAPRRLFHRSHGLIPMKYKVNWNLIPDKAKVEFEHFKKEVAKCFNHVMSQFKAQILFIPMYKGPGQDDDRICQDIISLTRKKENSFQLPKKLTVYEIQSIISNLDLVIGVRMHAIILSATCGVPLIGINYAPKGRSFIKMIGMEEFAINAEEFSADWLEGRIKRCLDNSDSIKKELIHNLKGIITTRDLFNFV